MAAMQRHPCAGGMQLSSDFCANALGTASHKDHGRHCLSIHGEPGASG